MLLIVGNTIRLSIMNKKDEEIRETYIEDTDDQEQVNNDEEQAWEEEQRKYNLKLLQDLLKEY